MGAELKRPPRHPLANIGLVCLWLVVSLFGGSGCHAKKETQVDVVKRTQGACENACRICNASDKALREEFGNAKIPDEFIWAKPFRRS